MNGLFITKILFVMLSSLENSNNYIHFNKNYVYEYEKHFKDGRWWKEYTMVEDTLYQNNMIYYGMFTRKYSPQGEIISKLYYRIDEVQNYLVLNEINNKEYLIFSSQAIEAQKFPLKSIYLQYNLEILSNTAIIETPSGKYSNLMELSVNNGASFMYFKHNLGLVAIKENNTIVYFLRHYDLYNTTR